ncbi:MAG: metalloregulator ArsR/SmtB family transcription factor [Candidatus Zixiibacteriota bacterium]
MRNLAAIARALADETRIRALLALQGRELCLCQLIELLGLATSTVSKHMAVLQQTGLVHRRKVGRWAYFRLPGDEAPQVVQMALVWVRENAAKDSTVREDTRRLREITRADQEALCRRQRPRPL